MTTKDYAIGVLTVTSVILFVGLLLVQLMVPQQAQAFAQTAWSGDYVVTTAQLYTDAEVFVILNAEQQRFNLYGFNPEIGQIELIQQVNIGMLQRLQPDRHSR